MWLRGSEDGVRVAKDYVNVVGAWSLGDAVATQKIHCHGHDAMGFVFYFVGCQVPYNILRFTASFEHNYVLYGIDRRILLSGTLIRFKRVLVKTGVVLMFSLTADIWPNAYESYVVRVYLK